MVNAVIFDLYRTLIYPEKRTKPYRVLFNDLGLDSVKSKKAQVITVMTEALPSFEAVAERLKPGVKVKTDHYNALLQQELQSTVVYPETYAVLEQLKKEGIPLVLISNIASLYTPAYFSLELNNYFDHHLFSCEAGVMKPHPEIYRKALEYLKEKPQNVLMVGDSITSDYIGPRLVGMNSILVDRNGRKLKKFAKPRIDNLERVFDYL